MTILEKKCFLGQPLNASEYDVDTSLFVASFNYLQTMRHKAELTVIEKYLMDGGAIEQDQDGSWFFTSSDKIYFSDALLDRFRFRGSFDKARTMHKHTKNVLQFKRDELHWKLKDSNPYSVEQDFLFPYATLEELLEIEGDDNILNCNREEVLSISKKFEALLSPQEIVWVFLIGSDFQFEQNLKILLQAKALQSKYDLTDTEFNIAINAADEFKGFSIKSSVQNVLKLKKVIPSDASMQLQNVSQTILSIVAKNIEDLFYLFPRGRETSKLVHSGLSSAPLLAHKLQQGPEAEEQAQDDTATESHRHTKAILQGHEQSIAEESKKPLEMRLKTALLMLEAAYTQHIGKIAALEQLETDAEKALLLLSALDARNIRLVCAHGLSESTLRFMRTISEDLGFVKKLEAPVIPVKEQIHTHIEADMKDMNYNRAFLCSVEEVLSICPNFFRDFFDKEDFFNLAIDTFGALEDFEVFKGKYKSLKLSLGKFIRNVKKLHMIQGSEPNDDMEAMLQYTISPDTLFFFGKMEELGIEMPVQSIEITNAFGVTFNSIQELSRRYTERDLESLSQDDEAVWRGVVAFLKTKLPTQ